MDPASGQHCLSTTDSVLGALRLMPEDLAWLAILMGCTWEGLVCIRKALITNLFLLWLHLSPEVYGNFIFSFADTNWEEKSSALLESDSVDGWLSPGEQISRPSNEEQTEEVSNLRRS
jgi:hypothetical protein